MSKVKNFYLSNLEHLLDGLGLVDKLLNQAVLTFKSHHQTNGAKFENYFITTEQVERLLNGEKENVKFDDHDSWQTEWLKDVELWGEKTQASHHETNRLRCFELSQKFQLNLNELLIVLIALAPEFLPHYQQTFAFLQNDIRKKWPTVGLVISLLAETLTDKVLLREAFAPESKLKRVGLRIGSELFKDSETPLIERPLKLDTTVVEYLLGHSKFSPQIAGYMSLIPATNQYKPVRVPPQFAEFVMDRLKNKMHEQAIFFFKGEVGTGKREVAKYVSHKLKRPLLIVSLFHLANTENFEEDLLAIFREGYLLTDKSVMFFEVDSNLFKRKELIKLFLKLLRAYPYPKIISSRDDLQLIKLETDMALFLVEFQKPGYLDRLRIWEHSVGRVTTAQDIDFSILANQYAFTAEQIERAVTLASRETEWAQRTLNHNDLLIASRQISNHEISRFVDKIEPRYGWEDIVLPTKSISQLRDIVRRVHLRHKVLGDWGFGEKVVRTQGIYALFHGESGTGKTMAAEIIANELGLDLYRVDLAAVVSKYIGETEKNLENIFSTSELCNSILFFDEADSIFGKRSEIQDSHDRYANLEVSYLLQRIEKYEGIVILATNFRSNIDQAFMRRLHVIVKFLLPDKEQRAKIWGNLIPAKAPTSKDIDFDYLSSFKLSGGHIRNIVIQAAYLAAEKTQVIGMSHLIEATKLEHQKQGLFIDVSTVSP